MCIEDRFAPLTQFNEWIWLGGAVDAAELETLRALGIGFIANITERGRDGVAPPDAAQGFEVFWAGQPDGDAISAACLEEFLEFMAMVRARGGKVLIHCRAGISRTPSFLIAWLMHERGCHCAMDLAGIWSEYEEQIETLRPIILPHRELKQSVLGFFEARPDA